MRLSALPFLGLAFIASLQGQITSSPNPADQGASAPVNAAPSATQRKGAAGVITAISPGQMTIKSMDGKTSTIALTGKTEFHVDRQPAKFSDFKVGDGVLIRGTNTGENEWQADLVAKRANNGGEAEIREALGKKFIVGEISAINGVQLTILRPDGVSQTIAVDENTSFRKQGESVTLADFKVGDHVFGRGELKENVFVPSLLGWGDPMSMLGELGANPKPPGK